MERRFLARGLSAPTLRSDSGRPQIQGYAACYFREGDPGTEYQLYSGAGFSVFERLNPGCFDRAVREDQVMALFNHSPDNVLGSTRASTLRLSTDSVGLRYSIDPPDTQTARDLTECLRRGDISGSSFSFDYLSKARIENDLPDGTAKDIIQVHDVKLFDVGPVTFPAYTSTTAGVTRHHLGEEVRQLIETRSRRGAPRRPLSRAEIVSIADRINAEMRLDVVRTAARIQQEQQEQQQTQRPRSRRARRQDRLDAVCAQIERDGVPVDYDPEFDF